MLTLSHELHSQNLILNLTVPAAALDLWPDWFKKQNKSPRDADLLINIPVQLVGRLKAWVNLCGLHFMFTHPFFFSCYSWTTWPPPYGFFEVVVHAPHLSPFENYGGGGGGGARAVELNSCTVRTRQVDQIWFTFKQLSRWAAHRRRVEIWRSCPQHSRRARSLRGVCVTINPEIVSWWVLFGEFCYSGVEEEESKVEEEDVNC